MHSYSKFEHHYTKSFFKYREPVSEDYRVFVNGEEIPVYTCRISAYPLNRVWTGVQRRIDQSELASYVNIVSDEEIEIEVIANRQYERVMIKPYSKEISYTEENGRIKFKLAENGKFVLECDSYHHCLYIFNNKPIPAPAENEVTYYFGAGIHFPGKITLNSNESVYIDKDALVFGWIYAENAENIHIFGNGILDDSGEERISKHCYEAYPNGNLKFYECSNLKIEGVGMKNSAIWCLNLFACKNVEIDDIKIFGQWRYNTDGIDIVNCQNIFIRDSFVHSFDDSITIKAIDRYHDLNNENIHVDGCVLWCDWGKVCEVGIETACREYKNISFRNCDILRACNVALDIANGDCAEISDVTFENINVEYNCFDTEGQYQDTDDTVYEKQNKTAFPELIAIVNYKYRDPETVKIWEMPEMPEFDMSGLTPRMIRDVRIDNIHVYYDEGMPLKNGKPIIPIKIQSFCDVQYQNIQIADLFVNGKKLSKSDAETKFEGTDEINF